MNQDNAICFQPGRGTVDTQKLFDITKEDESLRVQNENVNLLYYKLTEKLFDETYNFLNKYLDFNFTPITIDGEKYSLSAAEQQYLEQDAITSSIYFYAVNRIKIVLKPDKITLRIPFDTLLELLDKKYGADSQVSLAIGAHILRRPLDDYTTSVKQRRQYYNK